MKAFLLMAVMMLGASTVLAESDHAREKRWVDEITPGIVVGDVVFLEQESGHKFLGIYTDVQDAKMGLVVVHGVGGHPDIGMISTLRQALPDYGYATLSIQMPILGKDASREDYAKLLKQPDAAERLRLAVAWLEARGHKRIAIVSHSLGSRMTHGYIVGGGSPVVAWAALGTGTGPGPMITYEGIRIPVLDLYGANELPPVLEGASRRKESLPTKMGSKQVVIADTNHFFNGREDRMVAEVRDFLDSVSTVNRSSRLGQGRTNIKGLPAEMVKALREGTGAGLARAAELNHYPGPSHVLELAAALGLSEKQEQQTRTIFDRMQKDAIRSGGELLDSERDLERQFASGTVTGKSLQAALRKIGNAYAAIREVHLRAHIDQREILTRQQIVAYNRLRGYGENNTPAKKRPAGHHH